MVVGGLTTSTLAEHEQWVSLVRTFQNYDVYWLSGYVKAFHLHGDGEPLLFYFEGDELRGINVVMKRDIAKDPRFEGKLSQKKFFDLATPYGYGGWILEGKGNVAPLITEYDTWCCNFGIVSEFVRFHPVLQNQIPLNTFYEITLIGETITMDLSSPETIWANLTTKNRNMIRKAQKNGLQIYSGRFPAIYKTFQEIYTATMDRDQAKNYYYFPPIFYESIIKDLPYNAQIFFAQMKNEAIVAASIITTANGYMNYHLSGSLLEHQHFAPTNLLLYEAALWGCANGCKTLHLGGGVGSKEDSLYRFKKSFYRGDPSQFYIGRKIFLPDTYKELTDARADISENNFFPRYRA